MKASASSSINTEVTAGTATSSSTETVLTERARNLLKLKFENLSKLKVMTDELIALAGTQKEDFMQCRLINIAIDLLDTKLRFTKHSKGLKALLDKTAPPTSVRIKAQLTSSEKGVVASDAFAKLVMEYDTAKATFQAAAKDKFIQTKHLELEEAKNILSSTYFDQMKVIVESEAEMCIADMDDTSQIININKFGGPSIITAMAWRTLMSRSATPECLSVIKTLSTEAKFVIKMSEFLEMEGRSTFTAKIRDTYNTFDTAALITHFQSKMRTQTSTTSSKTSSPTSSLHPTL